MSGKERLEAAKDYVAARHGTIDEWKKDGVSWYGVSYTVWRGKENLRKVMGTGTDLLVVIDALKEKECRRIAGEPEPPVESQKATMATAAANPNACLSCGADNTQRQGTAYPCHSCGVPLPWNHLYASWAAGSPAPNIPSSPSGTGTTSSCTICTRCGWVNSPGSPLCYSCGRSLASLPPVPTVPPIFYTICVACGSQNSPGSPVCTTCSSPIP